MQELIKEKLLQISNKIKKRLSPNYLRQEMKNEKIIDLADWQDLPPFISSYETILCDTEFKKISQLLYIENKILLSIREMWNIYNWILKTQGIKGEIAELGVYKGGSAKLISEVKVNKKLYLFDTFEGLPPNDISVNKIKEGEIKGDSLKEVKSYLGTYQEIFYYPGFFPKSAEDLKGKDCKFSFVHLDADIYEATFDALKFFYPLLSTGGVFIIHDYRSLHLPGVKKAVDEFFIDKPETVVELWDTQALIIKQ